MEPGPMVRKVSARAACSVSPQPLAMLSHAPLAYVSGSCRSHPSASGVRYVRRNHQNDVGTAPIRTDAVEKVTGRAVFISDIRLPGMVHAKLWRSPLPHARLKGIDTTAAAVPGVWAILTADDFSGYDRFFGPAYKDQPI